MPLLARFFDFVASVFASFILLYLLAVPAFFLIFVWMFRREWWWRFAAILFMFLFGFTVYWRPGFTKPNPQVRGDHAIHYFAVADNTLSSFFMSRGGYDDFGEDKAKDSNAPTEDGKVKDSKTAEMESLKALRTYYFFHALCFAFSGALLCMMFARRLMNVVLVGSRARNVWRQLGSIVERQGKSAVFWDAGEESLAAAESLNSPPAGAKRGRPIFAFLENKPFVLQRDPTANEDRLDEPSRRYPWIYVDPETLGGLGASSLFHADEHYFLSPDGQRNVATANRLLEKIQEKELSFRPKVFIRIDADAEEDVLFQWADGQNRKAADIVLVHEPSQVAASLLREYPLTDIPGVSVEDAHIEPVNASASNDELAPAETESLPAVGDIAAPLRVMIVGFGAQGKAILRETVQLGVFPGTRRSIDVTVVDADEKAFEPLRFGLRHVNAAIDNSDPADPVFPARIVFKAMDARSGDFWEFVNDRVPARKDGGLAAEMPWNRVVFALPDDLENLRLAKRMERLYRNRNWIVGERQPGLQPIFFAGVRSHANTDYADAFASIVSSESPSPLADEAKNKDEARKRASGKRPTSSWVAVFGDLENLYSNLSRRLEELDRGAVYLNWTYGARRNDDGSLPHYDYNDGLADWRNASFFNKESSRASVAGMRNLARLLGWKVCEENAAGTVCPDGIKALVPQGGDPRLDALAKVEHLRWCAFLILRGIRPWLPETKAELYSGEWEKEFAAEVSEAILEQKPEIVKFEPKPDERQKVFVKPNDCKGHDRHAALVPFTKLGNVDKCFEAGTQKAKATLEGSLAEKIKAPAPVSTVDRKLVLTMPDILRETGWKFVKAEGKPL